MTATDASADTVLVTGGSGFLAGRAIIDLIEQGYAVRATVRNLGKGSRVEENISAELGRPAGLEFSAADLTSDEGWTEAVAGCRFVLHIASPFPPAKPKDPQELIRPAVDGATRVIEAALEADVERIVMTSSVAAVHGRGTQKARSYTEDDWTNVETVGAYAQSKTLAEEAAWALVERRGEREKLAVINPGAVLGPVMADDDSFSLEGIQRLLDGMPAAPKIGFNWVDVRDVSAAHLAAMKRPEAGGQRFITAGPFMWLLEVSRVLREELPELARKAPTRGAPNLMIRIMALFDPGTRALVGNLDQRFDFDTSRAREVLGIETRPIEETIVECAESLAARSA